MDKQWKRVENWLGKTNPSLLCDLRPGASQQEILEVEQKLNIKLPEDFIECLKIHNGLYGMANGLFFDDEFLSTDRITEEWMVWKNIYLDGDFDNLKTRSTLGIKSTWWSPGWVPFSYDGAGNHLCIDLSPTEDGQKGQVITLWHDDDIREKITDTFEQWFNCFVEKLLK